MKEEQERSEQRGNRGSDGFNEHAPDSSTLRCTCCPYGCHIDREFLCLAEGTKRNGVELSEWKKRHKMKMKHRQTMESLLMQSALPASGFSKQMETDEDTCTAVSDEQAMNRDGSETNSILLELDETIAEALKSIDELMNSKRRTTDINYEVKGECNSEELYASAKYSPERHSSDSASISRPKETRCGESLKRFMEKTSTGNNEGARSMGACESSNAFQSSQSLGKAKQHFEISDTRILDEIKLKSTAQVTSYSDSMHTNTKEYSCVSREINAMELQINSSVDCQMMTGRQEKDAGLISGSSDLTKAMAVLLPYDDAAAAASAAGAEASPTVNANSEPLTRLRQYITSGLRHMRNLEEQVRTIPVMQVRISVLKEEKKLLRLQLLSLQNALPSAKDEHFVDHFQHRVSSAAMITSASNCTDSDRTVASLAADATEMSTRRHLDLLRMDARFIEQENFAKKEFRIGVNWSEGASRSSKGQQIEKTTALETALTRQHKQLQRTTSLFAANNRLHEERPMAPLSRATHEGTRGNILRSASYSAQPDLSNRLLEFKIGSSETSCNFNQYSHRSLNRSFSSDAGDIAYKTLTGLRSGIALDHLSMQNSWNARSLRRSAGLRSGPPEVTGRALSPPRTFNEPTRIRKVCLTNDGRVSSAAILGQTSSSSSRHNFNVGIQCELLTAKKPMNSNSRTCCQCSCVENQRKRGLKDNCKTEETGNGGRWLRQQTPDVIITHCHNNNNNNNNNNNSNNKTRDVAVDEPMLQNQAGLALKSVASNSNSKMSDDSSVKSVDATTHTDDAMLRRALEHSVSQTDDCCLIGIFTKDAACLTDETSFRREMKDVSCFTDAFLSRKQTTDSCCATDGTELKPVSVETSCLTDPWLLDRVLRLDADSNTDEELVSCDRQDHLHTDTMHIANTFGDRISIAQSFQELLRHKDASCFTEDAIKPESKEVGCSTDFTLNQFASRDASCLTDNDMLKLESREVSCLTDTILDQKVTKDACCLTDKLLSKEVSCSTETAHGFTRYTDFNGNSSEFCRMAYEISVGEPHCDSHVGTDYRGSASERTSCDNVENRATQADENYCGGQLKASTRDTECVMDTCFSANKSNSTDSSDSSTQRLKTSIASTPNESLDKINNNNLVEAQAFIDGERVEKIYPKTEQLTEGKVDTTDNQFPSSVRKSCSTDLSARSSTETGEELVKIRSDEKVERSESNDRCSEEEEEEEASRITRPSSGSIDPSDRNAESNSNQETKDVESSPSIPVDMSSDTSDETSEYLELNEKLIVSCKAYSAWLHDSTKIASKQLNECFAIIQQEWFSLSSLKSSTVFRINKFLEEISKISPELRKFVVNLVDSNENTALHYAIPNRNFRLIDYLLSSGICDVNRRNRAGCTAVMLASLVTLETEEHKDVMKRLIEMSDVNTKSTLTGQTALMLAASRDHRTTVRLLLEAKANPNLQDLDGSTALMCASEHGYIATVRILLSHPASDPCICDNVSDLNSLKIS